MKLDLESKSDQDLIRPSLVSNQKHYKGELGGFSCQTCLGLSGVKVKLTEMTEVGVRKSHVDGSVS